MDRHEIIMVNGKQYCEVRDCYGRFLALLNEEGAVIVHSWYPPTNLLD